MHAAGPCPALAPALAAAEDLTRDWTVEEVTDLRDAVPAQGLNARHRDVALWDIGREVLSIARSGLVSRARINGDGVDESVFLSPLEEVLAKKSTLAEDMLTLYNGRWDKSVEPVFAEYQY